jgi:predicted permease
VIPVAAAIIAATAIGVVLERRFGAAADAAARRLIWAIFNVVLPYIVFTNIVGFQFDAGATAGLLFGYLGIACSASAAYLVGSRILQLPRPSLGASINLAFSGNTGYLGLPVAVALLGSHALGDAIAYDVLVSSPGLLIGAFAVGATFGSHAIGMKARMVSFFTANPPLYALIAALIIPASAVPHVLVTISHPLALALAPFGFLAVGITVGHERAFAPRPPVLLSVACKLLIPASVVALLSLLITPVPEAYVLQAAMACGVYNIAVASVFGLDRAIVAPAVLWSTGIVLLVALVISAVPG